MSPLNVDVARRGVKEVRVFVSWAHADRTLKDSLLPQLTDYLACMSGVEVRWWADSHLVPGEDVGPAIGRAIAGAHYGLLLLSVAYLNSRFICEHELPYFVGPSRVAGALPVALRPLPPFGGNWEFQGLDRLWIYTHHGKAYAELAGRRERFVAGLAEQTRRKIVGSGGYEPWAIA